MPRGQEYQRAVAAKRRSKISAGHSTKIRALSPSCWLTQRVPSPQVMVRGRISESGMDGENLSRLRLIRRT